MNPIRTTAVRQLSVYEIDSAIETHITLPHLVGKGRERVCSWKYRYVKRALDFAASLTLIAMVAVPGLIIAAAIVLTSPGPLFYREERVGRNGVPFRIWKFRTMYFGSEHMLYIGAISDRSSTLSCRTHKTRHDPRITRVGRFLRQWSLDELPQLLNILAGDMSLVGPRPIVYAETREYAEFLPFYLCAVPGLSGLWQVSGRSTLHYYERTKLDATYVKRWNLLVDFKILLRTIPAVLGRVGAW